MSKKNKALKQLIRAQMQANVAASAQGRDLSSIPIAVPTVSTNMPSSPIAPGPIITDKPSSEFVLIKKDIRLSLLLISVVIVCIFVIYFIDKASPFLLPLANKIFKLI